MSLKIILFNSFLSASSLLRRRIQGTLEVPLELIAAEATISYQLWFSFFCHPPLRNRGQANIGSTTALPTPSLNRYIGSTTTLPTPSLNRYIGSTTTLPTPSLNRYIGSTTTLPTPSLTYIYRKYYHTPHSQP